MNKGGNTGEGLNDMAYNNQTSQPQYSRGDVIPEIELNEHQSLVVEKILDLMSTLSPEITQSLGKAAHQLIAENVVAQDIESITTDLGLMFQVFFSQK